MRFYCLSLALATGLFAAEQPKVPKLPDVKPPGDGAVGKSIDRGIYFLLGNQNKDGSWGSPRNTKGLNIYAPTFHSHYAFRLAVTALCTSALIEADGEIRLYKFDGKSLPAPIFNYDYDKNSTKVCFLDLETTGLDKKEDKIIELAVKVAAIDKQSGELIGILDEYQSFEDPKEPINEKATRVNGITNEMVQDQSIDWEAVSAILNQADIIVAHNAAFDRAFMDRYLPISQDKVWACSFNDIDWEKRQHA